MLLLALSFLTPPSVQAEIVGGGGSSRSDCYLVLDAAVNHPAKNPRNIRCTDGDVSCDADGIIDGDCEFPVSVCINSTYNPERCTSPGVESATVRHSADDGDPKFDPNFQALQSQIEDLDFPTMDPDQCSGAATIRVPIKGPFKDNKCKKNRKIVRIDTLTIPVLGKSKKDRDKMRFTCDPAFPTGCDPQVLYTGTFNRIQRQIFDQTCAVSACHDSEGFLNAGILLLETGASHPALVNVPPTNGPALAEGWNRVTVDVPDVSGNPDTSYLVRKLNDDFPGPGFGDRMPLIGKKLDPHLRDIVTLWVAAGAPQAGWVPGTD